MKLEAIETVYEGYRFRSRLEARWAVFFDACRIPYQYEPEGFTLDDGTRYLPDFYLPWFECYVEIKPKGYEQVDEAKRKLERLFHGCEDKTVMLCQGDPLDSNMQAYVVRFTDSGCGEEWIDVCFLRGTYGFTSPTDGSEGLWQSPCDLVFLGSYEERDYDKVYTTYDYEHGKLTPWSSHTTHARQNFIKAKAIARGARFEHGETPTKEYLQKLNIW